MNRQGFLKGSMILLVTVAVTKALGLVYRIPLTRLLGGSGMGYLSSAFSVFTPVMSVAAAGIPSTMARLAAENFAFERCANLRRTKKTAMRLFTGIGLVLTAAVILLAMPAARLFTGQQSAGYAVISLAPALLFCTAMSVERGYYEGLHNMYPTAVSEMLETVFRLVLGLGAAYAAEHHALAEFAAKGTCFGTLCTDLAQARQQALPFIAAAAALGTSLSSGIACIYLILRSKIKGDGITQQMLAKDRAVDRTGDIVRRLLAYSTPVALTALIMTLAGMIDMLTVNPCAAAAIRKSPQTFSHLLSGELTEQMLPNFIYGSYEALAAATAGLVPTLTAMLGKSALAAVTESFAKGDNKAVEQHINKMLTLCAMIAFPSGLGISLLSEDILALLFSGRTAEIAAAAPSLRILGAAVVFMSLSLPCFTLLQALGKARKATVIMLAGGVVKLIGNLLLIRLPKFTLTGAAISTVISEAVICIAVMAVIFRAAHAKIRLGSVIIKPCYVAVMSVGTAFAGRQMIINQHLFTESRTIITISTVVFSVIMYLIVIILLCETPKNVLNPCFCKKNRKKDLQFSGK